MNRFEKATGIRKYDWYGKHWTKWSEAQIEAGYEPNTLQEPYDEQWLLKQLVLYIRELKSFPTDPQLKIKAHQNPKFPSASTLYSRLGNRRKMASKVVKYCEDNSGFDDVKEIAKEVFGDEFENIEHITSDEHIEFSFVYLMKSGKYYKIGRSDSPGRREYDINIQMPEEVKLIHKIKTDDPGGIEAYWHKRFEEKRKKGEWFELNSNDIKDFRRRQFM